MLQRDPHCNHKAACWLVVDRPTGRATPIPQLPSRLIRSLVEATNLTQVRKLLGFLLWLAG